MNGLRLLILCSGKMWTSRSLLQVCLSVFFLPTLWAISPDAEVLLEFKAGLTEAGVLANSWLASNTDSSGCPVQWHGVTLTTADCKVVSLSLSGLSLSGQVRSATLGRLSQLTSLSLSQNSLHGVLPDDLGSLSMLQDMDISENSISGVLPDAFKGLSSLVNLSLADNQLTGTLSTILELPQLVFLNLSGNGLTGALELQPDTVQHAKLKVLDLSKNNFSGPITPFLRGLTFLDLSSNSFRGSIPIQLGQCLNLVFLDLSRNRLSGPIPTMELLTSLTTLRLTDNVLTNEIPPELLDDRAPLLQELDLSRNQLNGTLGQVTTKVLNILKLASNQLEGPLPTKIQSCVVVDLSSNQFIGGIPLSKWSANLQSLDLSNNKLSGYLDSEALMQLFRLTQLDLSFNQLNGIIPQKLFTSSSVTTLVLSHNQFTGFIPAVRPDIVPPLQILDLSSNNLLGPIPDTIGIYTGLTLLSLSVNRLTGSIPWQLSKLSQLHDLDLSSNFLNGSIPGDLPAGLKHLNVSGNNLSGTVPQNLANSFSNTSFYPGNPKLTSPLTPGSSNASNTGVQVTLGSGHKRGGSGVKVGLIVGCTVGAALVVAASLLIYYKTTSKNLRERSKAVKTQQENGPAPSVSADVEQAEIPHPVPRGTSGKSALVAKARGDMKHEALDLQKSGESPMRVKWRVGGAPSSDDDSSISAEHPMVLKVKSPDRLAGDLFFLDASLLFTAEELSRAPAEVLGRSSHGTSYKATLDNGHVLTVKWLREGLAKNKKDFTREAKRFGGIKHPHVVSLRGYYWGPREHEKLLLSDFMSTGSLAGHLYERTGRRHPPLTWEQRLQVALGIASGLSYLHNKQGVAHGNLKASNVLLQGPQLTARIADYSLHRLMTAAGTANQILNAGALGYRSPELAATRKPKPSLVADVYALGVILMELITGKGAGDIISANCGAVDLPDWVRLVVNEGRPVDCFDPALVGNHRDQEPPKGMHEVLAIALSCMSPQAIRPTVKVVYDQLDPMVVE